MTKIIFKNQQLILPRKLTAADFAIAPVQFQPNKTGHQGGLAD